MLWLAFKNGRRFAASLSKENCSLETYLMVLKTGKIGRFSKAPTNLLSNRSWGFVLSCIEKLEANSVAWR
jgi:hypothetical protein